MNASESEELSKTEIARLRSIIQASGIYQKRFAECVDCRRIEAEHVELRRKHDEAGMQDEVSAGLRRAVGARRRSCSVRFKSASNLKIRLITILHQFGGKIGR